MGTFLPGLPETNEYHPALAGYVAKAGSAQDPIAALSTQLDEVCKMLDGLPVEKRLHRYAEGKWSIQQVLHHLIDCERVFAYRALRVARNDNTQLPGFDENLFAEFAASEDCSWDELIEEFVHVRKSTILLLRHLKPDSWTYVGNANGSPITVRAIAQVMIGHTTHHIGIVQERYL